MPFTPSIKTEYRSTSDDNLSEGGGSQAGNVQAHGSDRGMGANNEALAAMSYGLPKEMFTPSEYGVQSPKKGKKRGDNQHYSCEVCNIEDLNSLETKTKHENGKDHVYNVYKAWSRGQQTPEDRAENQWLEVFEDQGQTTQTRKKTCVRLAEKLQNTAELVVGLEHVIEIIACSSEEEPYYECHLCGFKGHTNDMFKHLLGDDHRRNVLRKVKPHITDDRPMAVERELAEFRQEDWSLIQRTYSDELYPWEAGKAPWSVERGGTGETPTGVIDKFRMGAGPAKGSTADSKKGILPANLDACAVAVDKITINDSSDLEKAMDLAIYMVDKTKKVLPEKAEVDVVTTALRMELSTLKGMGHKNDKRGNNPDPAKLWQMEQDKQLKLEIKKEKDRRY